MKAHIIEDARFVHDRERAHGELVRGLALEDEAHKTDVRNPSYLEAMELFNNLCSWIKRYLWRLVGMDPVNLKSYLNLNVYLFWIKRDSERWPKIAKVVRHLLLTEVRFRSST